MPSIFGSLQVPKSVRSPRKASKEGAGPAIHEVIVTREPGQKLGLIFAYVQNENGNDLVEVAECRKGSPAAMAKPGPAPPPPVSPPAPDLVPATHPVVAAAQPSGRAR